MSECFLCELTEPHTHSSPMEIGPEPTRFSLVPIELLPLIQKACEDINRKGIMIMKKTKERQNLSGSQFDQEYLGKFVE